jgi:hypothetical protein
MEIVFVHHCIDV